MWRLKTPDAARIELAGCQAFKIAGRAAKGPEKTEWVVDVRALSDGKILYLLSLRNKADSYVKNLETFEKVLDTLKLSAPR